MDKEGDILIDIRKWERERDRCIALHFQYVAAKFQRWIDKALKELEASNDAEYLRYKKDSENNNNVSIYGNNQ